MGSQPALWLHRAGVEVTVFEAVPEVKPLGVGINLLPHATKVLHQLGLQSRLEATAILTRELRYHSKDGKTIWVEPRGRLASRLKKILGRPALGQIHTNRCSYNA